LLSINVICVHIGLEVGFVAMSVGSQIFDSTAGGKPKPAACPVEFFLLFNWGLSPACPAIAGQLPDEFWFRPGRRR
jgi:hypothetical protein